MKLRKLLAERLEDRSMMTGVVNVSFANGELRLEAEGLDTDNIANGVQLTYHGFNTYDITSINTGTAGDTGTRFRFNTTTGPTVTSLRVSNIPSAADLYVKLKNGNDKFAYTQDVRDFTSINFRDAAIDMGLGARDQYNAIYLRVSRDWKIWGGQPVNLGQTQSPIIQLGLGGANVVGRDFCYFGGDGVDDFTMLATTIGRDVVVPPPPATYQLGCLASPMQTRDGNDIVTIQSRPTGPVTVVRDFLLDTGLGDDKVSATGLVVDRLIWDLNDGDDTVFFQSTNISTNSTVDGGIGYDIHTESTTAPRNNFNDANGNFILDLDLTLTPPATPPFTTPRRQGTTTNPNGAEMRFVNFENGQTRPPGPPGNGGNNPGPTGGRWVLRRNGSVQVSTSGSSNLSNLQNLVANSAAPSQPTVTIVNNRLLVSGTDGDDLIFVSNAGNGRVRVRVGSTQLGTFEVGQGLAVNSFGGYDTVYVAESISVSTMIGASLANDMVVGGPNMLLNDNGTIYANQEATEHVSHAAPSPATVDAALLLILGLPGDIPNYNEYGFGRRPL